jgi:hypothetical protein
VRLYSKLNRRIVLVEHGALKTRINERLPDSQTFFGSRNDMLQVRLTGKSAGIAKS